MFNLWCESLMQKEIMTIDEIDTLRFLFILRSSMQRYTAGENSSERRKDIIEAYNALSPSEDHQSKALEIIKRQLCGISFNPYRFKTTTLQEDKVAQQKAKESKTHNKDIDNLLVQISEELTYWQGKGKMTDIDAKTARFLSVALVKDGEKYRFCVKVEGRDEPLYFNVLNYKGKPVSSCAYYERIAGRKRGFDDKSFKLLATLGDKGMALEKAQEAVNAEKKYSPAEYKRKLGLKLSASLTPEQEKELSILNGLSLVDQASFLLGVSKRKVEEMKHREFLEQLRQISNPCRFLLDSQKMASLASSVGLPDFSEKVQATFIEEVVKTDADMWNNFVKVDSLNSRYSNYDLLLSKLIAENGQEFESALIFDDPAQTGKKVLQTMQKLQKSYTPPLPDNLLAEALVQGVFKKGIAVGTTPAKLKNMNLLLNEFGLNIKFIQKKVSKAPSSAIAAAAEQMKLSREEFEQDKNGELYKSRKAFFDKQLKQVGVDNPEKQSTHHYLALKYDAFLDEKLNNSNNYVFTARQHPWNTDGHELTHQFDTAGEFMVLDGRGDYRQMDFNHLRNAFNHGEELTIQIPILQVRDKQSGKFQDLLPLAQQPGQPGFYISNDQTQNNYVVFPPYCPRNSSRKDVRQR